MYTYVCVYIYVYIQDRLWNLYCNAAKNAIYS